MEGSGGCNREIGVMGGGVLERARSVLNYSPVSP